MTLKAAILGAGGMGISHAKRLLQLGVTVTCVCDSKQESIDNFLKEYTQPLQSFLDYDRMLTQGDFDMLLICLPPFAQDSQFEKAAKLGKHIFIEKPIALTTEIGKRMVESATDNDIISSVGFHMRKGGAVTKFIEYVQSGKAGKPVLFNGQYECNSLHNSWWTNVELSGGQIVEQAIHLYDMCRHVMGIPTTVHGLLNNICHTHIENYTVEDVSASITSFANGAVAALTATNCAIPGEWMGRFTIVCEHITACFSDCNHAKFVYTNLDTPRSEELSYDTDPYYEELLEFITCIQENKKTTCGIEEGYKSLCYVKTVVKSAHSNGEVFTIIE